MKKPWTAAEKKRVDREAARLDRMSSRYRIRAAETATVPDSPTNRSNRYLAAMQAVRVAAAHVRRIQGLT